MEQPTLPQFQGTVFGRFPKYWIRPEVEPYINCRTYVAFDQ